MQQVNIFWFRRDLRVQDNKGLAEAAKSDLPVLPVFIFDTNILNQLEEKADSRVEFIRNCIVDIDKSFQAYGSSLYVYYDTPEKAFSKILTEFKVSAVFCNHDYEPYATERDERIRELLQKHGASFRSFKDQVIFEKNDVLKDDGKPYTVFTPYKRKWLATLTEDDLKPNVIRSPEKKFLQTKPKQIPSLESMGFRKGNIEFPPLEVDAALIKKYDKQRDFPAIEGTTRLGMHLRFGTISVRKLAVQAKELNSTYLSELIWREFFQMILWHFPQVGKGSAFRPEYDHIKWRYDEADFEKWCNGTTGYPLVDAGMRQLNTIGFMHNRIRMVTASFLSKHLLIDWRWGEAYFAEKLLDFDLSANNGNWQWAAGSGCDAAPYFRIFNPTLQTKRFDPDLKYIRKWVPEFDELDYAKPMVDHQFARERCLKAYKTALNENRPQK